MNDLELNEAAVQQKKVNAEVKREKLLVPIVIFLLLFFLGPIIGFFLMFGPVR